MVSQIVNDTLYCDSIWNEVRIKGNTPETKAFVEKYSRTCSNEVRIGIFDFFKFL